MQGHMGKHQHWSEGQRDRNWGSYQGYAFIGVSMGKTRWGSVNKLGIGSLE